ncbi:MAG: hypothetical protein A2W31_15135 [Planctomycetes bacterium RBG_16_64_10]|nr:MAG: hypothetical protein A2W31_15135 [Planctomycetes bacterium RBG_16_64_10]
MVLSFDPSHPHNADRVIHFRATHGIGEWVLLTGEYDRKLSNGGEEIRLLRAGGALEDAVAYDDHAPWPIGADGRGGSLQRQTPDRWGHDAASWTVAEPTPGRVSFLPRQGAIDGDMNLDGTTNASDLGAFLMALSSPAAYVRAYRLPTTFYGDTDRDGDLDFDDIRGFVALVEGPAPVPGDVNHDGQVNGLDVAPFMDILLYGPFDPAADLNQDGAVDGLDLGPFVAAVLDSGQAPASASMGRLSRDLASAASAARNDKYGPDPDADNPGGSSVAESCGRVRSVRASTRPDENWRSTEPAVRALRAPRPSACDAAKCHALRRWRRQSAQEYRSEEELAAIWSTDANWLDND